jgi:hypothetical protein
LALPGLKRQPILPDRPPSCEESDKTFDNMDLGVAMKEIIHGRAMQKNRRDLHIVLAEKRDVL